ncbi:flagellar motor protein MotB [Massilia sp. PAMC28688]|uniref:flagellar motor protein MotB n=1 Tax=Massilia sp. PAMC28688 TaxID=2861283 RepID=UPI001C630BBB|nr:flagellar motor protein MotB [Massilia sp. PAMC28688]QYF92488.1 flagellar motor protein MotB [Massilia sp. PAMC28688]
MSDEGMRPIIVKRIKKGGGGHHGGAWKIAYADFVTAMMAFFLLMWLLGSTSKGDLQGIAEYFDNPLKVAMSGGSGSGDSSSVIQGGGADLSRRNGQVKKGDTAPEKKTYDLKAAKALLEAEEAGRLKALKARIEATIQANPLLRKYEKQLLLDITSEGLRIQIVDEQNRPMFATGSARLNDYTAEILHVIGMVLNEVPNRVGLSGHTDSTPYMTDTGYSNWELSADRANASRRALVIGGMSDAKILRVVGLASAAHLDRKDPFNAINRRISIIVMNKRTEEAVLRDGASLDVPGEPAAAAQALAPLAPGKPGAPEAQP